MINVINFNLRLINFVYIYWDTLYCTYIIQGIYKRSANYLGLLFRSYAGINFIHNHPPPPHPWGFAPKICPHPGAFYILAFAGGGGGGGDLLG